jgi:hypothetical protein
LIILVDGRFDRLLDPLHGWLTQPHAHAQSHADPQQGADQADPKFFEVLAEGHLRAFEQILVVFSDHRPLLIDLRIPPHPADRCEIHWLSPVGIRPGFNEAARNGPQTGGQHSARASSHRTADRA